MVFIIQHRFNIFNKWLWPGKGGKIWSLPLNINIVLLNGVEIWLWQKRGCTVAILKYMSHVILEEIGPYKKLKKKKYDVNDNVMQIKKTV